MVHLRKTNAEVAPSFRLIFSKNSRLLFLDCLSQPKPIEIGKFATMTIQGICKDRCIALLKQTFQRAVSNLDFMKKIDLDVEISKFNNILNADDHPLQTCIINRMNKLLSNGNINKSVGQFVVDDMAKDIIWNQGSFHGQFYDVMDKIGVVAMMRILRKLYQDENIAIFNDKLSVRDNELNEIFVKLYQDSDLIIDIQSHKEWKI